MPVVGGQIDNVENGCHWEQSQREDNQHRVNRVTK